jgi:hypothetical protein
MNSDGSVSDDDRSESPNEDHHAMSQTNDTIPPEASARLLTLPSHPFDAAIAGSTHQITTAFSLLRSSLLALDEDTLLSREPVVPVTFWPRDSKHHAQATTEENILEYSEAFLPIRLQLIEFQYAFAEAMEYLDEGWAANDVAKGVIFELPRDDDHDGCMRFTNVCMYVGLRRTIEIYTPFCSSASQITIDEAVDAIWDHLHSSRCPREDRIEVVLSVRKEVFRIKDNTFSRVHCPTRGRWRCLCSFLEQQN